MDVRSSGRPVALRSVGGYRPVGREGSDVTAERCGSDAEWIRTRTGIVERGVAGPDESVADMAVEAGAKALAGAGVTAADVDLVLLATCSTGTPMPGAAPEVAARLGATSAGACDVAGACAGFTYALSWAADAVRAGSADTVLVVGSERMRDLLDLTDRVTAPLFGDGAGAVVVSAGEADEPDGVGPPVWSHDGASAGLLRCEGAPPVMHMDGRAVYRWATTTLPGLSRQACERAGVTPAELAGVVPHQANVRITDAVVAALGLGPDVAVARDVVETGNTSAASVPLALERLLDRGEVRRGDPLLLLGFGAGLTAAGQVVRCP